jgi:hypothetical protein
MTDAPKTIWLLDTFTASEGVAKEPSRFSLKETMWHHDDTVTQLQTKLAEVERTGQEYIDALKARIDELDAARDFGILGGDVVAHMNVVSLQASHIELKARISKLEAEREEITDSVGSVFADLGLEDDTVTGLLEAAYVQGATDVHQNYTPDRNPDFSEAATDYARKALEAKHD